MKADSKKLRRIYEKTSGKCHLCHKKLAFMNYAKSNAKASWEIEHSTPKSKEGTDHLNNLYPACVSCNREKSNGTNYSVRKTKGVKRAPLSKERRKRKVRINIVTGIVAGVAVGRFFGPAGILIGGAIGAILGKGISPDKQI